MNMAVALQQTKVLVELEDLAGKFVDNRGSQKWEEHQFQAGLEDWGVKRHLDFSQKHELNTEETSQIFRDEHVVERMLSILNRLTNAVNDVHRGLKSRTKWIATKLSKGISSLPDDVLSHIFEFANPSGEGVLQALWLSQVSRRFRRVSLGSCHLWTTFHSAVMDDDIVATRLARCGPNLALSAVLCFPSESGYEDPFSFMDGVLIPLASRWRKLTIWSETDELECPVQPVMVDDVMQLVVERYSQLALPSLEELRITQRLSDFLIDYGLDSWPRSTEKFVPFWSMPNLRSMICEEYIPDSSPVYSKLLSFTTSFSLRNKGYRARFTDLLAFLDSAKAITDVKLAIGTLTNIIRPLQLNRTHCNSLSSLSLQFSPFDFSGESNKILRPLMESLVVPSLKTLSVSVEFRYDDLLEIPEESEALSLLVSAFLQDAQTQINLTSLNIEFTHTKKTRIRRQNDIARQVMAIPLYEIPYVSSLSIKTFCSVMFEGNPNEHYALRELRFQDCFWDSVWMLLDPISSMKEEGIWGTLETLKVERCFDERSYEDVLKWVGKERLRFVPSRRTKFNAEERRQ